MLAWSLHYHYIEGHKNDLFLIVWEMYKQAMTRVKANNDICDYHHHQLSTVQSGSLKAARMFFSVAAGKWWGNNNRWWQTLQNFSDYLIRY